MTIRSGFLFRIRANHYFFGKYTIYLENAIVTIDAMGCQTDIAKGIIKQKADYILAVKENQKKLYLDIESAFLIPSKDKSKN
ncbi:MAG: hypothetical protein K2X95_04050 [Flavobacteriaceae bacterium]|nr:hypothetical protein [Flavobacteriaceae bacterium]